MSAPAPTLESVTTINADGSRRFIHPADVRGPWTRWRGVAGLALLAVYFGLPWITINGHPAVFLDLAHRQFHFFGLTFVTQDLWIAFFLVSGLGFGLFYVTALLGRIWCGWACPQTVYLDFIRRIERWLEGDAPARERLDRMPWTGEKLRKRGTKLVLFFLFAALLAHMFLTYYVSPAGLKAMMTEPPTHHWGSFLFVFLMTAAMWFDFVWFREQFCIVLCPYGRLQSALIDNDSLVIGYDTKRGEPRGKKGTEGAGDCIDCRRCVHVCPTGIDIRQGLQMECIGCAACVDACDAIMTKLDRPRGLVRYDSSNGFAGKARRIIRPRILLYTALMLLGAAAMTFSLTTLSPITVSCTRVPGIPYVLAGENVRNEFLLRVLNKRNQPQHFTVTFAGGPDGVTWSGVESGLTVPALGEEMRPIIATAPRAAARGTFPLKIIVSAPNGRDVVKKDVSFVGPGATSL
jgi:cytochrome c oxidase accessory protein FixG